MSTETIHATALGMAGASLGVGLVNLGVSVAVLLRQRTLIHASRSFLEFFEVWRASAGGIGRRFEIPYPVPPPPGWTPKTP